MAPHRKLFHTADTVVNESATRAGVRRFKINPRPLRSLPARLSSPPPVTGEINAHLLRVAPKVFPRHRRATSIRAAPPRRYPSLHPERALPPRHFVGCIHAALRQRRRNKNRKSRGSDPRLQAAP